jgi:hypothetical protein
MHTWLTTNSFRALGKIMQVPVNCPNCQAVNQVLLLGRYEYTQHLKQTTPHSQQEKMLKDGKYHKSCAVCGEPFVTKFIPEQGGLLFNVKDSFTLTDSPQGFAFGGKEDSPYPWKQGKKIYLEYEGIVRDGENADFLVLSSEELEHYENHNRFRYLKPLSEGDTTSVELSGLVPKGHFWIIADKESETPAKVDINAKGFSPPP